MAHSCKVCGKRSYSPLCTQHKPRKRIGLIGRRGEEYIKWRDEVARPFLDDYYGHQCAVCGVGGNLDVDHKIKRGSHSELKMELSNVRYLCRVCHRAAT